MLVLQDWKWNCRIYAMNISNHNNHYYFLFVAIYDFFLEFLNRIAYKNKLRKFPRTNYKINTLKFFFPSFFHKKSAFMCTYTLEATDGQQSGGSIKILLKFSWINDANRNQNNCSLVRAIYVHTKKRVFVRVVVLDARTARTRSCARGQAGKSIFLLPCKGTFSRTLSVGSS